MRKIAKKGKGEGKGKEKVKKGKEKGKRKGDRKMWEKGGGKLMKSRMLKAEKKGRVRGKEGKWISMAKDRSGKIQL